jgi:DNA invertase Pin-like site-specific DNA recombinase
MTRLIGFARLSTDLEDPNRDVQDLIAAGVQSENLFIDREGFDDDLPQSVFSDALAALAKGDTLVVTTLQQLGRRIPSIILLAELLRDRQAHIKVLDLAGQEVDTATPKGSMLFAVLAGLAQMELQLEVERRKNSGLTTYFGRGAQSS